MHQAERCPPVGAKWNAMTASIPLFQLSTLTATEEQPADFFFLGPHAPVSQLPISLPYRSNYYKIGLCLRGQAQLKVDLETYDIGPNSLMLLSPYVIKQWPYMSADFEGLSIFFTQAFISAKSGLKLDAFSFFERDALHVFQLTAGQANEMAALLHSIEQKYLAPHIYREEILRSLIQILLHETAPIYSAQHVAAKAVQTRGQLIASEFKQLVSSHYASERSLGFYADKLCITPKHLAETVREATGKRAVEWLTEAVLLEAHVLLQNPALSIAQIADTLHFADQSTFGRFFRKSAGVSPAAFRQGL
ncbi:AraC family transcriptional regulator [Hymenobacter properus]|uniref:AraC family transcriptional regulator n=1 Tax=Hymenobacter properus TaxID=2791026 RepID=A0A931BKV1_9BACT|nr:helix-turn-helix domain-containing protein [Hymenobacter properus]MBF9144152.1 AraC family transcriptional regulator [Hymenobacter properus]MBR7722968.1 AraC family transcriptional regulator [Microvirga sp. SRT04]